MVHPSLSLRSLVSNQSFFPTWPALHRIHIGLWPWVTGSVSAAAGEDPGARCEGKNGCLGAIAMLQRYLHRGWGQAGTVVMAVWERDSPTWDAVQAGWIGIILGVSWMNVQRMECTTLCWGFQQCFVYGCVWTWVLGWDVPRIAESIHLSYLFTPAGELEVTFPPVSSTDAVWLALGSVTDCEERHGQVFESMCFVLTDRLLQTLWHWVENGSLTAEGICPSWRYEFFLGWRSCCVLPASILAEC